MPITINEVQRQYIQEVVRPMIERLIAFRYALDAFVLDTDNQQTPIPNVADVINDNQSLTGPRSDAPQLNGSHITQLRNFAANMRDQITGPALNTLVSVAVRDVQRIIRE